MGLFGQNAVGKPPKQPGQKHGFDWGAAAMGFFGVPASVLIKKRQDAAEQAQLQQIYSAIDNDPNLPTPEAKQWAKLNPKAYAEVMLTRFQTRQFGPEGGSVMQPGAAGPSWTTAPRFDSDGNIFGPGNGMALPPVLQRGRKMIPYQQGGGVAVFDGIDATRLDGGGDSGPPMLPRQVHSKAEYDALPQGSPYIAPDGTQRVKGGASPSNGSITFP